MEVRNQKIEREGYVRFFRTITDQESSTKADKVRRKFEFLREIVENGIFDGTLTCGPLGFDKFYMQHNGIAWEIKLESEEYKNEEV